MYTFRMAFNKWVLVPFLAIGLYFLKKYMNGGVCTSDARLDGKTVIVTGANAGIGKETVRDLARRGGHIIMGCRSQYRCNAAANEIRQENSKADLVLMTLDLSSFKSIREFVKDFKQKEKSLHILINNAGVMWTPYQKTEDGFEMQFGVNHLGHFLLTNLLLDRLKASQPSRIVTVSSNAAFYHDKFNFEEYNVMNEKYGNFPAYALSKLANILFSKELAGLLKGSGVTTYSLHPGTIMTEIGKDIPYLNSPLFAIPTYPIWWLLLKNLEAGAQTTICCAVNEALKDESGFYYSDCEQKRDLPPGAQNDDDAKQLWDFSMKLTGLDQETKT